MAHEDQEERRQARQEDGTDAPTTKGGRKTNPPSAPAPRQLLNSELRECVLLPLRPASALGSDIDVRHVE